MIRNWGEQSIITEKVDLIAAQIQLGNVIAASDGSVQGGKAAHVWCISDKNGYVLHEISAPVDGGPLTMTSFRAEACGALAIVTMLKQICDIKNSEPNKDKPIRMLKTLKH